jgi:hypothetical protein
MRDKTAGAAHLGRRSPEEIVLDGWLEDLGPYVNLEFRSGRRSDGRVPETTYKVSRKANTDRSASYNSPTW